MGARDQAADRAVSQPTAKQRWLRGISMTPADLVVILASAALIGYLFARSATSGAPAGWVEVRALGAVVGTYPLDQDRELSVRGRLGDSKLRIEGGRVRFVDSPCPNKVCVHSGWLQDSGEFAACVPNGVSLRLIGAANGVDGVT